ncbi:MAG TPA: ABC transporter substrate-binding protein [Chloroflexota bacterium]|nr:ABC transporter substrate-binding protein [Chloroflexota bacterium]
MRWLIGTMGLTMLLAMSCAPASRQAGGSASASQGEATSSTPQKELVVAVRGEPPSIAAQPITGFSGSLERPKELFNGTLDYYDENGTPQPELAQALPKLNTDTWKVLPDGTMDTTYKLKPNLTWHDGTPLSGDDFVFAFQVYSTPSFGVASTPPIGLIQDVTAPDASTVTIKWKSLYPDAAGLGYDFQALPRHILQESYTQMDPIAFAGIPFWTNEYVGLGPYRVTGWEAGAYIAGEAFDAYALGRPKIDRVRVLFISDPDTAVANLMAGSVAFIADPLLSVSQAQTLEQQGAEVLYSPVGMRTTVVQMRPDIVEWDGLLDLRVRTAIAYSLDVPGAIEALTAGKGVLTHTLTSPQVSYYPQIEKVIQKLDYDPRKADQTMSAAGYTKGSDGFFVGSDGQRAQFSDSSSHGDREEMELSVYVDSLRKAGFDVSQNVVSVQQIRDPKYRSLLPGLQLRGGAYQMGSYTSDQIPRPENHWVGDNRGGWSNPTYDRLFEEFNRTLDESEHIAKLAQLERILTTEVPIMPNMFSPYADAFVAGLKGPVARHTPYAGNTGAGAFLHVEKWEWTS